MRAHSRISMAVIAALVAGCGGGNGTEDATDEEPLDAAADPVEESPACSPRLFILLDSSASMLDGTPSGWEETGQAVSGFLDSGSASGIEFGLGHFPTDDNCAVDGLVVHALPEASPTNVATYLTSTPEGNTPLVGALEFLATDTTANLDEDGYHNALVVITDGWECCTIDCMARCTGSTDMITCLEDCQADIDADAATRLAAAATALRDTHGVRTFVIGIGDEVKDDQLSAIAGNGGTADGEWISTSTSIGLENALGDIADELRECLPVGP